MPMDCIWISKFYVQLEQIHHSSRNNNCEIMFISMCNSNLLWVCIETILSDRRSSYVWVVLHMSGQTCVNASVESSMHLKRKLNETQNQLVKSLVLFLWFSFLSQILVSSSSILHRCFFLVFSCYSRTSGWFLTFIFLVMTLPCPCSDLTCLHLWVSFSIITAEASSCIWAAEVLVAVTWNFGVVSGHLLLSQHQLLLKLVKEWALQLCD